MKLHSIDLIAICELIHYNTVRISMKDNNYDALTKLGKKLTVLKGLKISRNS